MLHRGEATCGAPRCSHPPHQGTVHGAARHRGSSEQRSSLTSTRPTALRAGCDAACKSSGTSVFQALRGLTTLTGPDAGLSVARGPGGKHIPRAGRPCHPDGCFPPLCKKTASNVRGCARWVSSCSSDGLSWAIFESVCIKLTSLSLAWPRAWVIWEAGGSRCTSRRVT